MKRAQDLDQVSISQHSHIFNIPLNTTSPLTTPIMEGTDIYTMASNPSETYTQCINGYLESGENDIVTTFQCITAENSQVQKSNQETIKVLFLVYCSSLVFLMQAGFAMICSGCVRRKNVQNTILKNLLDVCGSSVAFFFVGYAFAFGGDPNTTSFIGDTNFLLIETAENDIYGLGYAHWLFQFAFAATSGKFTAGCRLMWDSRKFYQTQANFLSFCLFTATIVAGTLAERCQMNAYLLYSMMITGLGKLTFRYYVVLSPFPWLRLSFKGEKLTSCVFSTSFSLSRYCPQRMEFEWIPEQYQ
jgi:hypothetical protein